MKQILLLRFSFPSPSFSFWPGLTDITERSTSPTATGRSPVLSDGQVCRVIALRPTLAVLVELRAQHPQAQPPGLSTLLACCPGATHGFFRLGGPTIFVKPLSLPTMMKLCHTWPCAAFWHVGSPCLTRPATFKEPRARHFVMADPNPRHRLQQAMAQIASLALCTAGACSGGCTGREQAGCFDVRRQLHGHEVEERAEQLWFQKNVERFGIGRPQKQPNPAPGCCTRRKWARRAARSPRR